MKRFEALDNVTTDIEASLLKADYVEKPTDDMKKANDNFIEALEGDIYVEEAIKVLNDIIKHGNKSTSMK